MSSVDLHFIVGIWRSGTTLLREVLGMSEAVKVFPEHFVLLNHLNYATNFTPQKKEQMIKNILENKDFLHFAKPNATELKSQLHQSNSFEEAMKTTYLSCVENKAPLTTLIDKNPIYSYYLPFVLEQFPTSKFIWMLREPKDNCISRAKHKIQHFKNYSYLAHWWNYTNHEIAKAAVQYPDRFLLIPYDQMVVSPTEWIERICEFLGVEFLSEMLAFETKKEERAKEFKAAAIARDGVIKEEYAKRKVAMWENLQKPINSSKTKQWEQELSSHQIQQIDGISKNYFGALVNGNFQFSPPTSFLHQTLLQASLRKLKWDISHFKKH